jgi:outer membrane protein OmpA-like peptidoglycan-associated protein
MTTNLLDLIKQGLPGDFSDLAGKVVGESPGATQTALTAALPALVGAIAQKGSTADGAQSLMSLLDNPAVSTGALANLSGLLGGGQNSASLTSAGSGLLGSLLGDKAGALAGTLASVAGLRNGQSASSLLALLAPIVLGFIKKFVGEKGLGASGLASLLAGQGQFLQGTLDRRLTSALGFASPSSLLDSLGGKAAAAMGAAGAAIGSAGAAIGSAGATAASTAQRAGAAAASAAERTGAAAASAAQRTGTAAADVAAGAVRGASGWMRWLPWLIGAIIVLFLLSRLSTCSETADKSATAPPVTAPAATAPSAMAPAAPSPSAMAPAAPASTAAPAATTSGVPAKVSFDVGSATLSDDAKKAITGAADAAKQAGGNVELTGYTDKTGDAAKNEELAKNRAVAVKDALVAAGLAESAISMKPPAFVTGGGNDNDARRVEITKAP